MKTTRQQLRQQIRQQRNQLTAKQQQEYAQQLCNKLIAHPAIKNANSICGYLANDGEISLAPFINWCWQQNKSVYIPILHPFTKGHLIFQQYHQHQSLVLNKFGIGEPPLNANEICPLKALDVLLTPLVAFDKNGGRLGMGGGFYDRTLAPWYRHRHHFKLNIFGIAHDLQCIDKVPSETWDIPLPNIITPSQQFTFSE